MGLNADLRADANGHPAVSYLAAGYYQRLAEAGACPVVVPPLEIARLEPILEQLDGLVFVGSQHDLDPMRDGFYRHRTTQPMPAAREDFDRALLLWAIEQRLPVLAIGAGMQLLNVVMGGTLSLHIREDFPKAMPHCDPDDAHHRHEIRPESRSLMKRVYGEAADYIGVISRHHMAVDDVADGFAVTARSPDGIIEAIESTDRDWLAVGVQWHPEATEAPKTDRLLFDVWLEAAMLAPRRARSADRNGSRATQRTISVEPQRTYTRREAADYLGISFDSLTRMALEKGGPAYRVPGRGRESLYLQKDLDAWLQGVDGPRGPQAPRQV